VRFLGRIVAFARRFDRTLSPSPDAVGGLNDRPLVREGTALPSGSSNAGLALRAETMGNQPQPPR